VAAAEKDARVDVAKAAAATAEEALREIKAAAATEMAALKARRAEAAAAAVAARAALVDAEAKLNAHSKATVAKQAEEQQLAAGSVLPDKVLAELETLDRRALAEIARMSAPPAHVKSCLEIVYVFLEVFREDKAAAAVAQASSPPKAGASKDSRLPSAEWPEIRKLLAVDLRPRLLAISPQLVAQPSNEPLVAALRPLMAKLNAAAIRKASKPAGKLWVWCTALAACEGSIKQHRRVARLLQTYAAQEAPMQAQMATLRAAVATHDSEVAFIDEITKKML
jgi:hypothetical protein